MVRPAGPALSRPPEPGDRLRRGQGHQGAVPGPLRREEHEPEPDDAKKFGELLKQTNPNSEVVIYPNVGHGFFADYRPSYNAEAAADAWKRCTGLFAKSLKA